MDFVEMATANTRRDMDAAVNNEQILGKISGNANSINNNRNSAALTVKW